MEVKEVKGVMWPRPRKLKDESQQAKNSQIRAILDK